MISTIYTSIALLSACTYAYVPNLPRQTQQAEEVVDPQGWTPRPTSVPEGHPLELFKRQEFAHDAGTVLVAPDATCGFISGLQGAPFTCNASYKCVFFSATGGNYGPVACCTTGMNCRIRTACVDSSEYFGPSSSSVCDDGCRKDAFTLKCTNSAKPWCASIRWTSPNVQDYWCDETSMSTWRSAASTFEGQTRIYSTANKQNIFGVTSTSSSTRTSSSTNSQTSTSTIEDSGPGASQNVPTPSQTSSEESSGSSTPVGAIVGGVIGGIALLAIIGLAIFFIRRKYGNKSATPGDVGSPPPPQDPYAYQQPPQTAQISEMDTSSQFGGDPRYSQYSPNTYNAAMVHQHYDPPKPPQPYAPPPQELYAPTEQSQTQQSYQPVPTEIPVSQASPRPNRT